MGGMIAFTRMGRWAALVVAAACAGVAPADEAVKGVEHRLGGTDRTYEMVVPPLPAERMKDMPLAVYLHPSGDPQLDRARRDYAPLLAKRGCLLAIPTSRSTRMWLEGEDKMVADVIADARTRYSVDPKRILLIGVSGGGQVALLLADRMPETFRAVVAVSTSPVVARDGKAGWFYPDRRVLKKCPYLVINHITQGSSLMYWRQVRAKLNPAGASISVLPVTGPVGHYLPPPPELGPWLDAVLAGKHPRPLPDPQKRAVAKMFAPAVAKLPKAFAKAARAGDAKSFKASGKGGVLTVSAPGDFGHEGKPATVDSTGAPLTQLRLAHAKWPITIRADARATGKPMKDVLAAEAAATAARGMLYQVYRTDELAVGRRRWRCTTGSITYPDRRRGWVSALFCHCATPVNDDPRRWVTVTVNDETQQPDPDELATILKTVLARVAVRPVRASAAP